MTEPDPDKLKGPSGLTLRQIHVQVKQSVAYDRQVHAQNKPAQKCNRWQRFVRYVWDKNKGKPIESP